MVQDFEQCYRAVSSKDGRFDGWFVTAVTSTGIYCRPSCPAVTPKRANVRFLRSSAEAQRAGFRACKRCRPDASPGSPEWNVRADVVGRAMRLIADGAVDRDGVAGLAQRLGFSERHLHRQLVAELGAGPIALARAQRAHTARLLIETTRLPFTEVAFAAGFPSIRQFNDTVREVFATTPTELRRRSAHGGAGESAGASHADSPGTPRADSSAGTPRAASPGTPRAGSPAGTPHADSPAGTARAGSSAGTPHEDARIGERAAQAAAAGAHATTAAPAVLTLRLRHRPPFDGAGLLAFLGLRAVPGVERLDAEAGTYSRVLELPHGPGVVALTPREHHVDCELRLTDLRDLAAAVQRCRRLLDLDADPHAIDAALGADPLLRPLVARTPGLRVPGAASGAELAVRAVLGQQISVQGARTLAARLTAAHGAPLPAAFGALTHAFPTAAALAALDPEQLPMPRARGRALVGLCGALASGAIALDPGADRDATRAQLLALPGIGPWTAEYVAMRALGDPDAFPTTDLGIRHALARLGQPGDPRAVAAAAERWRPWRAYAALHLWASLTTEGEDDR